MARFDSTTLSALPQPKAKAQRTGPSNRELVQTQYQTLMSQTFNTEPTFGPTDPAIEIHLEEGDNPLTERNRLLSAARVLGHSIQIKRRKDVMYAFRVQPGTGIGEVPKRVRKASTVASPAATTKSGRKSSK